MRYQYKVRCVISSFITKPQLPAPDAASILSCVISSFITKPQLGLNYVSSRTGCVISSFITKPQLNVAMSFPSSVALYPLSSPNHNYRAAQDLRSGLRYILFHHQTTTPIAVSISTLMLRYILFHHQTTTCPFVLSSCGRLRYILFHHQTTTPVTGVLFAFCCVISSFITKPQPSARARAAGWSCVISSFITKPQPLMVIVAAPTSCVISSFITKPQLQSMVRFVRSVALYPLSSPNHNVSDDVER